MKYTKKISSPDKSRSIILVSGYISTFKLFIDSSNNNEIKEIGTAEEVVWSNNSRYIAFTSKIADAGSTYKLTIYDTQTDKSISMNEKIDKNVIQYPHRTSYHNPRWLADSSGITVNYKEYDDIPNGKISGEGTITVLLEE